MFKAATLCVCREISNLDQVVTDNDIKVCTVLSLQKLPLTYVHSFIHFTRILGRPS